MIPSPTTLQYFLLLLFPFGFTTINCRSHVNWMLIELIFLTETHESIEITFPYVKGYHWILTFRHETQTSSGVCVYGDVAFLMCDYIRYKFSLIDSNEHYKISCRYCSGLTSSPKGPPCQPTLFQVFIIMLAFVYYVVFLASSPKDLQNVGCLGQLLWTPSVFGQP